MEVKGQQRSNIENYALWQTTWFRRIVQIQIQDDDDLHGGQLRHVLNPTQIESVTIITISGIIVFR